MQRIVCYVFAVALSGTLSVSAHAESAMEKIAHRCNQMDSMRTRVYCQAAQVSAIDELDKFKTTYSTNPAYLALTAKCLDVVSGDTVAQDGYDYAMAQQCIILNLQKTDYYKKSAPLGDDGPPGSSRVSKLH